MDYKNENLIIMFLNSNQCLELKSNHLYQYKNNQLNSNQKGVNFLNHIVCFVLKVRFNFLCNELYFFSLISSSTGLVILASVLVVYNKANVLTPIISCFFCSLRADLCFLSIFLKNCFN